MSYIQPIITAPLPHRLNVRQFVQTVMAGVSGIPGPLVRPSWQPEPPKQPDLSTTWMAMAIQTITPNANSYLGVDSEDRQTSQRMEDLEIECQIYGPDSQDIPGIIWDGFQIQTNREALLAANMGFIECTQARHVPDLINQRWFERWIMTVRLNREVQRVYPVLTFVSASGVINTVLGNEDYLLDWKVEAP